MSESDISVILAELKNLTKNFEEFKVEVKETVGELKAESQNRCNNCVNSALLKQRQGMVWTNIVALWTVIGAVTLSLFGTVITHIFGK